MKRLLSALIASLMLFYSTGCGDEKPHITVPDVPPAANEQTAEDRQELTPEELAEQERLAEKARRAQQIEDMLSGMTLEEKIGQLFFLRCPASGAAETVAKYHLGGILLFTQDYKDAAGGWLTKDAFCAKIDGLQAAAQSDTGVPLFIGSDEEGGTVTRASRNPNLFPAKLPSPQELYKAGGMAGLLTDTLQYNDSLRALGINVNFAPVCDVTSGPGQFMYERSFGQSAEATADYIAQTVGVMGSAGIGATLKHFPGYGDNVDTHTGIAVDTRPYEQFENEDFLPFLAGIKAGAQFVLVNHNIVECIDETYPASLSFAMHGILRSALGFDGVILTDDLDMGAVKAYAEDGNIGVLALAAGNDMLVCSDLSQIAAIADAVRSGGLSQETVDFACRRVLTAKQELGLFDE